LKRYTITLELDFETDGDPIDRTHEIMQQVLHPSSEISYRDGECVAHANKQAEHYHLDAKSLRSIDE